MESQSLPLKPTLTHASPSFRLHSPSLNTLRLRRVFDLFDTNHDDQISTQEFCAALDCLGLGADPADLSLIVASHIPPGQSGLAFEDFKSLHRALGDALFGEADDPDDAAEEADMLEAFKVFDEDADGFISAKELQVVLGRLGLAEGESIHRVRQMICAVDRDNDGRIDFREFKTMMQGITGNA